jgi:hypothetical protein
VDVGNKLNNYLKITGNTNNIYRPQKLSMKTRIKLSLPAVLYSSENWTVKGRETRRITAAETKYMRKAGECTWIDYKTNTEITEELNLTPVLEKYRNT